MEALRRLRASVIDWIISQPTVSKVLNDVVDNHRFQAWAASLLGRKIVTPDEIVSVLLLCLFAWLLLLRFTPKARLTMWASIYFCASRDKTMVKSNDENFNYDKADRRTVIFIRDGESEFDVINKGRTCSRPWKWLRALLKEAWMIFDDDSRCFDSPLSDKGIDEAWELLTFLGSQKDGFNEGGPKSWSDPCYMLKLEDLASIIRGDVGDSIVCCSVLRRAVTTGVICLSARLLKMKPEAGNSTSGDGKLPPEKVKLMTSLQEIGRNVDTLSLTACERLPQVPRREASMKQLGDIVTNFYRERLSGMANKGNKDLGTQAKDRQRDFCKWLFNQRQDVSVIVCGHSTYFQEFFKSFLPKASSHRAKQCKLQSCGCVAFDFYKQVDASRQQDLYRIHPERIKTIFKDFGTDATETDSTKKAN